jgi:ketosteroid isomerase-like protein
MTDRAAVDRWLDAYVEAWRSYDREAIESLFSEDCKYSYRPHGDAIEGREAIVRSWLEDDRDQPGTYEASYRAIAADGDTAVAVGTSTYTETPGGPPARVFDNCFVMRFDSEGRCREFTEWFMERRTP